MILPHDDRGTGPAVVLLHAGIVDRGMWAEQLGPLAEGGFRAIALDLPGFGEAPMPVDQDAPWIDVLETLDWLAVERFAVIGNSIGGWFAQRVAALVPDRLWALGLISSPDDAMEDPSPELKAAGEAEDGALDLEDIDRAVEAVIDAWTLPDAPSRLRLRVAQMQRRAFELQAQDGQTPEGPDPVEADPGALGRLEVPVLVAYGERDMSDFAKAAERLAAVLGDARLEVIGGAGHLAPMERPRDFNALLLGFLSDARPS